MSCDRGKASRSFWTVDTPISKCRMGGVSKNKDLVKEGQMVGNELAKSFRASLRVPEEINSMGRREEVNLLIAIIPASD